MLVQFVLAIAASGKSDTASIVLAVPLYRPCPSRKTNRIDRLSFVSATAPRYTAVFN
jgi:hypothetical protein